jgi:hypothetical protein
MTGAIRNRSALEDKRLLLCLPLGKSSPGKRVKRRDAALLLDNKGNNPSRRFSCRGVCRDKGWSHGFSKFPANARPMGPHSTKLQNSFYIVGEIKVKVKRKPWLQIFLLLKGARRC